MKFSANLTSRGLVRTSGTKVQAEEVGIVLVVLLLWAAAIALFINRWGKIRQMEPYHPYVEETEAPVSQQPPNPASIPQSNQVNNKNIMTWFCHIQHYSRLAINPVYTVRTPIVDPFPIEDPSLKILIEDLFLFSKKWVLGVLY